MLELHEGGGGVEGVEHGGQTAAQGEQAITTVVEAHAHRALPSRGRAVPQQRSGEYEEKDYRIVIYCNQ